jgi:hypothetical protein
MPTISHSDPAYLAKSPTGHKTRRRELASTHHQHVTVGFTHTPKPVDEAIHLAVSKKVLMFAAASNNGVNGTIAKWYRARDSSSVFGIYSTDFNGRSSTFNPPPAELDYNFSTLGENISSVLTGNAEFSLTGTSVSTPIAAATAALVLEFIRQWPVKSQPEIRHVERLLTLEGMRADFKAMAPNCGTNRYNYLTPWMLLRIGDPGGTPNREEIARQHIASVINKAMVDHFGW